MADSLQKIWRDTPSNFLKAVFHKIYSKFTWILCPKWASVLNLLNYFSFKNQDVGIPQTRFFWILYYLWTHSVYLLIVSATRMRADFELPLFFGPTTEKLIITSNDHRRTIKWDFLIYTGYTLSEQTWSKKKKIKIVSLN